ncbi:MAG: hypothetical protein ACOYPR_22670 [Saprospiraceae bacterium]
MIPYEWFRATWVAVKTDNHDSLLQPIGLSDFSSVDWETGIKAAVHQREEKLFISPVINGWVLFFGDTDAILERYYKLHQKEEDPEYKNAGLYAALTQMSMHFPEVQFFSSFDDNWQYAKAAQGQIQRAFYISLGTDGSHELGTPSQFEILNGGTMIPGLYEQYVELKTGELPYLMAGIWSVNPLEFDEPQWEWLRKSHGLLYNGVSDTQRENREYWKNWLQRLKQAYIEDKYGIEINRPN